MSKTIKLRLAEWGDSYLTHDWEVKDTIVDGSVAKLCVGGLREVFNLPLAHQLPRTLYITCLKRKPADADTHAVRVNYLWGGNLRIDGDEYGLFHNMRVLARILFHRQGYKYAYVWWEV
jgi:hypothetical protein